MMRPARNEDSGRPLVLVVDDDPSARKSVSRLARAAGFDVQTYASAEQFVRRGPASRRCHCLILDLALPGMSGLELLGRLRGRSPVIVATANADDAARRSAIEAGVFAYVRKPYAPQALLNVLVAAVAQERPNARQPRALVAAAGGPS